MLDTSRYFINLNSDLQSLTREIHDFTLNISPNLSCKDTGSGRFQYGIQNKQRMRPIVLNITLPRTSSGVVSIAVDGQSSDPINMFARPESINNREWRVKDILSSNNINLDYIKARIVESYEHLTQKNVEQRSVSSDYNDASDVEENDIEDDDFVISEDRTRIRWADKSWSVRELVELWNDGEIIPQPHYQRGYVWKPGTKRRFVESILMRLPIPVVYLSETNDGKYEVIDGQQRLTTIKLFVENSFTLSGLHVLGELNGKYFKDLEKATQRQLKSYQITARVLESSCPPDLKFDMFERLNTGSVQLNKQELRNCICRGGFNEMLKELASSAEFLSAMGWAQPNERMKGEELILRFFVFRYISIETISNYEKSLTGYMRDNVNMSEDRMHGHKKDFKLALKNCVTVFGDQPFRMWKKAIGDKDANGCWESQLSSTVFEVLMTGLACYESNKIVPNADTIKDGFIHLVASDQRMFDSMKWGTNTPEKMRYRNMTWRTCLGEIIGDTGKNPRFFSSSFKEQLWKTDPYCELCGQKIATIDDASVDHIHHYWRGGETIPSNARLTHRYCNSKRGGRY